MLLLLASLCALASAPGDEHRYLPSRKTPYYKQIDDLIWSGTVTEAGEFAPDLDSPPRSREGFLITGTTRFMMSARSSNESVFEYRFGRLIPGNLLKGEFIPRAGGKVIAFQEYLSTYSKVSARIYNLPGKIVTQEAYEHLKAEGRLKDEDK